MQLGVGGNSGDGSSQETHVPACTHCNCRCVLSSPALRLALQRLLCFVSCIWGLRALNCLHYFLPVEGAQRISIRAAGPPTPIIRGSRGHRIYMSVRRGQASLHQPRRPLIGVDHIPPGQLSGGGGVIVQEKPGPSFLRYLQILCTRAGWRGQREGQWGGRAARGAPEVKGRRGTATGWQPQGLGCVCPCGPMCCPRLIGPRAVQGGGAS